MLKMFVASLRPKEPAAPIIRFETEPGEQMQVDWAVIRRGSNRLSVFVAALGWSRASYVEFVTDERVETLIAAHENAFLAFSGVPQEVLYDNMRTVVVERHGYGRGRHRFHPGFLDFARHCGFRHRASRAVRRHPGHFFSFDHAGICEGHAHREHTLPAKAGDQEFMRHDDSFFPGATVRTYALGDLDVAGRIHREHILH